MQVSLLTRPYLPPSDRRHGGCLVRGIRQHIVRAIGTRAEISRTAARAWPLVGTVSRDAFLDIPAGRGLLLSAEADVSSVDIAFVDAPLRAVPTGAYCLTLVILEHRRWPWREDGSRWHVTTWAELAAELGP